MARVHTRRLFFWDVSIRNSLRSNKRFSTYLSRIVSQKNKKLEGRYIEVSVRMFLKWEITAGPAFFFLFFLTIKYSGVDVLHY